MAFLSTTGASSTLILFVFLAAAVASDLHRRRIPNALVAIMLVCGFGMQLWYFGGAGLLSSLGGTVVGFLVLIPFYAIGGMGAGDVKLLAGAGSFLGLSGAALAGVSTLLVGGVLGLAVVVWQRVGAVLAARFLSIPTTALAETSAARIPYSLAIAAGTVVAIYQYEAVTSLLFND